MMNMMFRDCSSLSSLPDISKWNTQNLKDMSIMCSGCSSLITLPNISKWETHNITNMRSLFFM